MKKNILFPIVSLSLLVQLSHSSGFVIKLASYKNRQNLLQKIDKLGQETKENTYMVKEEGIYKLYSKEFDNREKALMALPQYREVFADAYITTDSPTQPETDNTHHPINLYGALRSEANSSNNQIQPVSTKDVLQPIGLSKSNLSFRELFQDKTFYLVPNKIIAPIEKILIKAVFSDTQVSYHTVIGNVPDLTLPYIIQHNRLYTVNHNRVSPSQFSSVEKILFDYMVVSRWMKGKKIHQMRYYKKEDDAKSYIDSVRFD